jgi:hypothetical protein
VTLARHGTVRAPNTQIEGFKPIDGIFTTQGISIQGSGYLSFAEGVTGKPDHREAYVDITMTSALGHNIPEVTRPSMQRVTTRDIRSVKAFHKAMHTFVKQDNLGERIVNLERSIYYPPTAAGKTEAKNLMNRRLKGIKQADRIYRKLSCKNGSNTIPSGIRKTGSSKRLLNPINERQGAENEDKYQRQKMEPKTQPKRQYKRKLKATVDIMRQSILRERERVTYRRMGAALKPQRLSTSMVIAVDENKEWTERTTKTDMEKAITEHHIQKCSLTHTTPSMRTPAQQELGFDSLI